MSKVPDAWEDEWSSVADKPTQDLDQEPKKPSTKITKAQKRAQQAEFNKQFWAEAEGPAQPNYFLESRNVVPLKQDFKPAPILLSRKGPILQAKPRSQTQQQPLTESLTNLTIVSRHNSHGNNESSDDDEEETEEARKKASEERQAQAAREREEKQRKYEERRLELFGPPVQNNSSNNGTNAANNNLSVGGFRPNSRSGNSSPGSNTPPHSRSSTPNSRGRRGRGGGGGGGDHRASGRTGNGPLHQVQTQAQIQAQGQPRTHTHQAQYQIQQHSQQLRELYEPQYSPRPESLLQRQHQQSSQPQTPTVQPIRNPKGPDGSGRGGFGFASRNDKSTSVSDQVPDSPAV